MTKLVLAGDIGGTKTLLQLAEVAEGAAPRALHERLFDSAAHDDFTGMVGEFLLSAQNHLGHARPPVAACFGVAGPIHERRAKITNLTWSVDAAELETEFAIPKISLINDFAAVGYGIEALSETDLETLQAGTSEPHGVRAVLGAGTGLGEGILVWREGGYRPLPSEGGHVDFAPVNEEQIGLLRHLQARYGHVSYERIVSGAGLVEICDYVLDAGLERGTPEFRAALTQGDPAATISAYGMAGRDPAAARALQIFVAIYGAQAGNLALTLLARGGVYIAGGIAPKIIAELRRGAFMRAFLDKGRFAPLLQGIPVRVVMNPKVGLMGAVAVAGRL